MIETRRIVFRGFDVIEGLVLTVGVLDSRLAIVFERFKVFACVVEILINDVPFLRGSVL